MSLLDLLFPKYCVGCKRFGSYLCADCFAQISFDTQVICLSCGKGSLDGMTHPGCRTTYTIDGVFCAVAYRSIVKKLIYVLKYQPYVSELQHVLVDIFYEALIQKEAFVTNLHQSSVLVPIPLSSYRLKQRGYNQSYLLGRGLSHKLQLPLAQMLIRGKETKPQFGLSRAERKLNMKGAFSLKKDQRGQYTTGFLIDDVLTTGTTLHEAASVLKRNGFQRVWGVTFARD